MCLRSLLDSLDLLNDEWPGFLDGVSTAHIIGEGGRSGDDCEVTSSVIVSRRRVPSFGVTFSPAAHSRVFEGCSLLGVLGA